VALITGFVGSLCLIVMPPNTDSRDECPPCTNECHEPADVAIVVVKRQEDKTDNQNNGGEPFLRLSGLPLRWTVAGGVAISSEAMGAPHSGQDFASVETTG